jgi:hypothetical protein
VLVVSTDVTHISQAEQELLGSKKLLDWDEIRTIAIKQFSELS